MPLSVTFCGGNRSASSIAMPHSPPSILAPYQPPMAAPARESRLACAAKGREKLRKIPTGKLAIISAVHAQRKLSSAWSMLKIESPSVTSVRTGA